MGPLSILSAWGRTPLAPPAALIVAEIGQNHNGRLDQALELVDAARWSGADAVKVTKRDLSRELSREARDRPYHSPHSYGATYGEHRRALELSADAHAAIRGRAREHGLSFVATVCDAPSADLMTALEPCALKIASRDLANLPLVETVARRGLPVILSTGMSDWAEIDPAVRIVREHGTTPILLHCTSLYPTPLDQAHLRSIPALVRRYGCPCGFSDHTPGIVAPLAAVALGARVIEKHLTLDRQHKGSDHAASIEPDEFRRMVDGVRDVERALGSADKPVPGEVALVRARLGRSLTSVRDLAPGTRVEAGMLDLRCPGTGISWADRGCVLGRRLARAVLAGQLLTWSDLEPLADDSCNAGGQSAGRKTAGAVMEIDRAALD
jgi:sialic acid synthase SpsE